MGNTEGCVLCDDCSGKVKIARIKKCEICGKTWELCEECYYLTDLVKNHKEYKHKTVYTNKFVTC